VFETVGQPDRDGNRQREEDRELMLFPVLVGKEGRQAGKKRQRE